MSIRPLLAENTTLHSSKGPKKEMTVESQVVKKSAVYLKPVDYRNILNTVNGSSDCNGINLLVKKVIN